MESDNDNGEVERGFFILRGELSSDFQGVVPSVMDLETEHKRDKAWKSNFGRLYFV